MTKRRSIDNQFSWEKALNVIGKAFTMMIVKAVIFIFTRWIWEQLKCRAIRWNDVFEKIKVFFTWKDTSKELKKNTAIPAKHSDEPLKPKIPEQYTDEQLEKAVQSLLNTIEQRKKRLSNQKTQNRKEQNSKKSSKTKACKK